MSGNVSERGRAQDEAEMKAAEAEFRTAFQGQSGFIEWRSTVTLARMGARRGGARPAAAGGPVLAAVALTSFLLQRRSVPCRRWS